MISTRICPTINRDLHLGHIINMFLIYYYAKNNNGEVHIRCVLKDKPEYNDPVAIKSNIEIFKILFSDVPVVYLNDENIELILWQMRDWFKEHGVVLRKEHFEGPSDAFLGTIFDKIMGVNTIIRGREWSGHVFGEQPQTGLLNNYFLEYISNQKIEVLYHPVLCMDGNKISKSACKEEHLIKYWLEKGVTKEKFIEWFKIKVKNIDDFFISNDKYIGLTKDDLEFLGK